MDLILHIAESDSPHANVYFRRPLDTPHQAESGISAFVTFYSPRQEIPARIGPNHFRIPFKRQTVFQNMLGIIELLIYELSDRNITVHFGWPTSSWFDRLSTGVMVFQFMALPKKYPQLGFEIESPVPVTGKC